LKVWSKENNNFRALARHFKNITLTAMKLALAVLIYLIIASILGAGILLLVAGKPWFLAIGVVAFIVAFGRIGCMPKKPH
jgi:hypothetical protein